MACPKRFFLPVRVLSRFFRRVFLDALSQAAAQGKLHFYGQCQSLSSPAVWRQWITTLRRMEWVVYAKRPLAGAKSVLQYLARYTRRVAITNRRLLALQDGQVTFRWKDYKRGQHNRIMTLEAVEFIRRFLLHVLPHGFQRMRHYGFLANGVRQIKLPLCRRILGQSPVPPHAGKAISDTVEGASAGVTRSEACPSCRVGRMQVRETWFAQKPARELPEPITVIDTT
jgi:hypothetical protein